ncbi:hypothetical protein N0V82_003525 [Gnomoniopsis sp. IMI 355080]|nr:hypothetical protein N0V82_003525 [Gnomoniopsis sp. IMI 355080]
MSKTFTLLAANSETQFLPTPISESLLRRVDGGDSGSGGTNLRVGFIELLPIQASPSTSTEPLEQTPRLRRLLEQSWPIGEHLKNENAESLFSWIGEKIAEVVARACRDLKLNRDNDLPMGVTFSFPMAQRSLSQATLMSMGKGFAISDRLDLDQLLLIGYEKHRQNLPRITIAAIANDSVATLVSFIYQFQAQPNQKAAMGLICGTGSNATIPLKLSSLHQNKRPEQVSVIPGQAGEDVKIAVNTEWSINGSAPPLYKLGLFSHWDTELDQAGEVPGFQPLEYMSSGRYLGELGRLIFLDYLTNVLGCKTVNIPPKLQRKFGLSTTFLSHFNPQSPGTLLQQLESEFPLWKYEENEHGQTMRTEEVAEALYRIALAIEMRAAAIVAASTIGLLRCAGELPVPSRKESESIKMGGPSELVVGYTGGCIVGFQNYLHDCQTLMDTVIEMEYGKDTNIRVILSPCHDGGITGAGILVPASLKSERK